MTKLAVRYSVDDQGCWLWQGPRNSDGVYGKWNHTTAHRIRERTRAYRARKRAT